ncbi:MAG: hypothetical protein GXP62_05475 [Oligoflexia bacterium]|nr:hypothetical protein [Oligoflexia bacterium]
MQVTTSLSAVLLPLAALPLAVFSGPAHAGRCDYLIKRADTTAPADLARSFQAAADCDADAAGNNFTRFMTRATDADSLVALSLAAIDANIWNPVWVMPSKITDYDARDLITGQIGAACTSHPKVTTFLQGAYLGLRELDFGQWDDAFVACKSPDITQWLDSQLASPPATTYDAKYDQLMAIYVSRLGPAALDGLKRAAIAAAENGPFDAILMKMDEAVAPKLGAPISPDNQEAIEAALEEIAQAVSPEKAHAVADRLVAADAEDAAARLLPVVYPDRQQDGFYIWGGVSVERADCKGTKTAVLHTAKISEPGKRWIVTEEAFPGMRAYKAKLKKCTPEDGDWPVVISPEPLKPGTLDEWARTVGSQWAGQDYQVEIKTEKGFALP